MKVGRIDLDRTLGCGQVFRWSKDGGWWKGVISNRVVKVRQRGTNIEVVGDVDEAALMSYFRADDDLDRIVREISKDDHMAQLVRRFDGLRLVRQDPWECASAYTLATYASIPRIEGMIENVCRAFGHEIAGGSYSFPRPEEILENEEGAKHCNLGFRCRRFVEFARRVERSDLDFDRLKQMEYRDCVEELKRFEGVGDKVADCIALFSLDHLEAFPIDVRIKRAMERLYSLSGSYKKVSGSAREYFGRYAGYAQEYIFISEKRGKVNA
jgi:N-glycosylase/DNA lyase